MADRWATFDCYGTIVDWNAGIRGELGRLLGDGESERLLGRYHELEPEVQRHDPALPYREVMARVLEQLAREEGTPLPERERDALGRSLPSWPVFPDAPAALNEAHERGWKLVMLSNTDREFIEASIAAVGAPFELSIVAGEIGSYKPAYRHWEVFFETTGADREAHVHVAQSHFHDIVPAHELAIPTVWINRLGERGDPAPTREMQELSGLADVIDELIPPR
jgi:2-haloacid dehalogenase